MNLWIRSQDKKILIPINKMISVTCDGLFYDGIILGIYKTKERALEVLDEIQNLLIPKVTINTFNIEKNDLLDDNQYLTFKNKDFSIKQFETYVYQMPKK